MSTDGGRALADGQRSRNIKAWRHTKAICGGDADDGACGAFAAPDTITAPAPTAYYALGTIPSFRGVILGTPGAGRTRVRVSRIDPLAAAKLQSPSGWTLVLCMASAHVPGGNVWLGAAGQEEDFFRRTNYFRTLKAAAGRGHPYPTTRAVAYSPQVTVIKDEDFGLLRRPYSVAMVAAPCSAAPAINPRTGAYGAAADRREMQLRIRAIFELATLYGHNSLVLAPLGCGPQDGHPAAEVAGFFAQELEERNGQFREIIFAVPAYHPAGVLAAFAALERVPASPPRAPRFRPDVPRRPATAREAEPGPGFRPDLPQRPATARGADTPPPRARQLAEVAARPGAGRARPPGPAAIGRPLPEEPNATSPGANRG